MRAIRLLISSTLLIALMGSSIMMAQPAGDSDARMPDGVMSDHEMPDGTEAETAASGEPSGAKSASGPVTATDDAVPAPSAGRSGSQATEVGPPVYWLRDKEGELHAVPGMTIDDFWRAYELIHQLDAPTKQPAVVISRLDIEAQLVEQPITIGAAPLMKLGIGIDIEANRTGWLRVPLGFTGAVYDGGAQLTGSDVRHYVAFEGDLTGYVLWLDVKKPGQHHLSLPLKSPTEVLGGGGRCQLALPLVAQSRLSVTAPSDDMDVTVTGATVETTDPATQQDDATAVASEPRPDGDESSPDDVNVSDVADEQTGNGGDEQSGALVYSGLGREVVINWRQRGPTDEQAPPALEALDGTVVVSIDGQTITSEALLKVRSLGGPIDQVFVRLPDRAELIPRPQSGYRVSVVTDRSQLPTDLATTGSAEPALVSPGASYAKVTLTRPTSEPVEIRLFTQRRHRVDDSVTRESAAPSGGSPADTSVDLGGFEVLGALRQSGYIAVGVVGDWQLNWSPPRGVRQVSAVPAVLHRGEFVAGFEYVSQPFSLPLRVTPRRSRIGVEPRYVVRVEPDGVYLEARLNYAIGGANALGVSIDMRGWTVDEIGPASVVDLDGVDTDATSPLFVPFLNAALGKVEVVVRARRELGDPLTFTLPRPVANTLGPAELIVLSADNVVLSPRVEQLEGLRLDTVPPDLSLPVRQQEPLVYRAGREQTRFVADAEVMPGVVTASVETQLHVSDNDVSVQQRLKYDAEYEAVANVELLVPNGESAVAVTADGTTLALQEATSQDNVPTGFTRVAAALPSPRIGSFELTVEQRHALDNLQGPPRQKAGDDSPDGNGGNGDAMAVNAEKDAGSGDVETNRDGQQETDGLATKQEGAQQENSDATGRNGDDANERQVTVPLTVPADATITASHLSVSTESGVYCEILKQTEWEVARPGNSGDQTGGLTPGDETSNGGVLTAVAATGKEAEAQQIAVGIRRDSQPPQGGIRVERAWVRTRLGDRSQDVLAAYRFTTPADRVDLVMPPNWQLAGPSGGASEVETVLDGEPVAALRRGGVISIMLGQMPAPQPNSRRVAVADQPHVLEVRFTLPPVEAGAARFKLSSPRFEGSVWVRRMYWEVDLPRGRRVLGDADGFVGEYQWQRHGLVWSRESPLTSADLANWVGVPMLATDAISANRYLFSAIDPPAEIEISAPRLSTIVLWASGASLIAGLLLINVPRLRHPGVLWVCGVAVVACSVMYLELAVVIAQASSIGLALVLLAVMLERFFSARRHGGRSATTGSSLFVKKRDSRAGFSPLLAVTSDSTQTSPVVTSGSSHGSKS